MTEAKTPRYPEAAEFVRWLYERSGATTVGEFSELVDEPARKVYRWLAGDNAPRFESAVRMMKAAGVLDTDAPVKTPQSVDQVLAALEQRLEQRLDEIHDALRGLGATEAAGTGERGEPREQPPPAASAPGGGP